MSDAGGGETPHQPLLLWLASRDEARAARWKLLFTAQGWPVSRASSLDEVEQAASCCRFGLAMVDLEFLKARPIDALKRRVPHFLWVVVGSAGPSDGPEAARCLEEGAEDYIPAGFDDRILVAKLRAHVKRLLPMYADSMEKLQDPCGTLKLDRSSRRVSIKAKGKWTSIDALTDTESRLLSFFLLRPDVVLDKRAILEGVWLDRAEEINPETVGRHLETLRKKLGPMAGRLQAVYGRGYVFRGEA